MKIHVFYRHTLVIRSNSTSRPAWFSHKSCLQNFIESVTDHLLAEVILINLIFDGTHDDLREDESYVWLVQFLERHPVLASKIETININGGNQRAAARACLSIVRNQLDSKIRPDDLVYLLENDYVHQRDWVEQVMKLDAYKIPWDYITLYDHPDKYPNYCAHPDSRFHKNNCSTIYCTDSSHWKTVSSTCGTYLVRANVFTRDYWLLRLGIFDFKLFSILTKLFRRRLISPIPSISTHSMNELLAPVIDWQNLVE